MMHSSLRLSNLSKLRRSIRSLAIAAASTNPSLEERQRFADVTQDLSIEDRALLLPAFYAILDPARIPGIVSRLHEEESYADDIITNTFSAFVTLRNVTDVIMVHALPAAVLRDLWTRFWPWIEFLDEYHDTLSLVDHTSVTPADEYSAYVSLCYAFDVVDKSVRKLTRGSMENLCRIVGTALRILHLSKRPLTGEEEAGLSYTTYFLRSWFSRNDFDRSAFDALLLGSGGTVTHLACLVVGLANRYIAEGAEDLERSVATLGNLFTFMMSGIGQSDHGTHDEIPSAFEGELFKQGLVSTATKFALLVCDPSMGKDRAEAVLGYVQTLLSVTPRHRWVVESLRAGLLPALFASRSPVSLYRVLRELIPSTVYYSVLAQLRESLTQVDGLDVPTIFPLERVAHELPPAEVWEMLTELVAYRLEHIDKYATGIREVIMACHNVQCAEAKAKSALKVCSGCKISRYCSKECQAADWHDGHRQVCPILSSRRKADASMSARDKWFFEVLVHEDYGSLGKKIAAKYLHFALNHPDQVPYTLFDYSLGNPTVEVGALKEMDPSFSDEEAAMITYCDRVLFHLIKVSDGGNENPDIWLLPVRFGAQTPNFVSGLRKIVARGPLLSSEEGMEQVLTEILTLMPSWDGMNGRWWHAD
ncbi:hypothetical protein R3P38DRAFT_2937525 [Favolaschia claudopus]|uniref:phytol kinase n=1 Tax=Favolaschia claudopus TaxID=2862362 RepID=A0AAW0BPB9_9AGAR